MTTVNAFVAMKLSVAVTVKNLAKSFDAKKTGDLTGAITDNERKANAVLQIMQDGFYSKATIGSDQWVLFDILIDHRVLEKLDENIPTSVVAGCWNPDGTQFGQTRSFVPDPNAPESGVGEGRQIEVITGTPVYPIHSKLLDFMPDDVEYNADGSEESRKRPTKLKQVHKYLGWADRRWT